MQRKGIIDFWEIDWLVEKLDNFQFTSSLSVLIKIYFADCLDYR